MIATYSSGTPYLNKRPHKVLQNEPKSTKMPKNTAMVSLFGLLGWGGPLIQHEVSWFLYSSHGHHVQQGIWWLAEWGEEEQTSCWLIRSAQFRRPRRRLWLGVPTSFANCLAGKRFLAPVKDTRRGKFSLREKLITSRQHVTITSFSDFISSLRWTHISEPDRLDYLLS